MVYQREFYGIIRKKIANWLLDYYNIDTDLTPPIVENFQNRGILPQQLQKQQAYQKGFL